MFEHANSKQLKIDENSVYLESAKLGSVRIGNLSQCFLPWVHQFFCN